MAHSDIQKDKEALELFNEKAEKLEKLSFTKTIFEGKSGIHISGKVGEPLSVIRFGPDEEATSAFVLTFRFFIQDNERSSFNNIEKIYNYLDIDKEEKEIFRSIRKNLNDFLNSESTGLQIEVDGKKLSNRHILDVFVYGGLAHANKKKKQEYDSWMRNPVLSQLIENEFISILGVVMKYIISTKNLNEKVIKEIERSF